jgi:hypothetical protein
VPSQNGDWLHHGQRFPPAAPEASEQHPENTIDGPKLGPRSSVNEARELVAQGNILGDEICTILENRSDKRENQWNFEGLTCPSLSYQSLC